MFASPPIPRYPSRMLVDSHCHLDFPEFAPELDAVVARARAAGVGVCVSIGTTLAKFPAVRAVAERFDHVWCSVGIHPHEAEKELLESPAPLIEAARHPKVVGIGETGLDYYYEHSPRAQQVANFRAHIEAARQTNLPVIVHTRDADDDTITVLREEMAAKPFTGLIHCFTGTRRLAEASLDLGLSISVSGIATFKKSDDLRAVLKDVPLDRLLVETDAPYLAPMPHRGKRNEPAFVAHTAAMLADLKGVSAEDLAAATTENFFRLFTKVTRPDA
jgi:TatD DNase family protein